MNYLELLNTALLILIAIFCILSYCTLKDILRHIDFGKK